MSDPDSAQLPSAAPNSMAAKKLLMPCPMCTSGPPRKGGGAASKAVAQALTMIINIDCLAFAASV